MGVAGRRIGVLAEDHRRAPRSGGVRSSAAKRSRRGRQDRRASRRRARPRCAGQSRGEEAADAPRPAGIMPPCVARASASILAFAAPLSMLSAGHRDAVAQVARLARRPPAPRRRSAAPRRGRHRSRRPEARGRLRRSPPGVPPRIASNGWTGRPASSGCSSNSWTLPSSRAATQVGAGDRDLVGAVRAVDQPGALGPECGERLGHRPDPGRAKRRRSAGA